MKKLILSIIIVLISVAVVKSDIGLFDGIITTKSITNVTVNSATSGGNINLYSDDPNVTQKGIVWNTSSNPTTSTNLGITYEGSGPTQGNSLSYTSQLTNLQLNTTYYVRAYLINGEGIYYGNEIVFTTIPTLGEWGVIALISLMGIFGIWTIWRKVL